MSSSRPRLYFAYGSNLSLAQMSSRCPTSTYHSFGVFRNYKWIIGERGYANVIKCSPEHSRQAGDEQTELVVYGMLYTLQPQDEENLDRAEGVPWAYVKKELEIELLSSAAPSVSPAAGEGRREVVKALVYVDEKRRGEGVCKEEYVMRMNRGIRDAMGKGMDEEWVRRVMRPFVREGDVPSERDGEVEDPFDPKKDLKGAYENEME